MTVPSPLLFPCALLREALQQGKRKERKREGKKKNGKSKKKKTQQEASRTLQEMHFSNTNSFPTGWRSAGGHQLLLLLVRAVRLAPADLSSRPPLQPLSARPQPPAPPAAREGGGRVHFELISAVKGSNNKINALGSSGPAERRGTRANGAGSSRGGGLENSTRSAFETQLPDPFCRCSGAGSSEPMGGSPGYCAAGGASQRDAPNLLPGSSSCTCLPRLALGTSCSRAAPQHCCTGASQPQAAAWGWRGEREASPKNRLLFSARMPSSSQAFCCSTPQKWKTDGDGREGREEGKKGTHCSGVRSGKLHRLLRAKPGGNPGSAHSLPTPG